MGKKGRKNKQKKSYAQLNGVGSRRRSNRLNEQKKGSNVEAIADDYQFRQSVEEGGSRTIVETCADGNCLFRSISDQLFNDYGNMHDQIRHEVCDYIEANEDEFAVFLVFDETEEDEDAANFEEYCVGMREDGAWGGNVELVAAARLYRRNITVFSEVAAFTIEHGAKKSSGPDMMLSYHDNDHYNSVRENGPPSKEDKESQRDDEYFDTESKAVSELQNGKKQNHKSKNVKTDDETPAPDTSTSRKKSRTRAVKPNDPCVCGSVLRYKKCCLPAEKRKERLRKWQEKNGIDPDSTESGEGKLREETIASGKLKVLSI